MPRITGAHEIGLHQKLVTRVIKDILRREALDASDGERVPVEDAVAIRYARLRPATRRVMVHDDPLDVAFDFAAIPVDERPDLACRVRESYENLVDTVTREWMHKRRTRVRKPEEGFQT